MDNKESFRTITEKRKVEHIEVCLKDDVKTHKTTWFEYVMLLHNPIPEVDMDEIDLSTTFLNKKVSLPLMITAMTGGSNLSKKINGMLAEIAEEYQIPMGVGSQRAAIEEPSLSDSYKIVREKAPTAIIIGNIGAPQLAKEYNFSKIMQAVEMIDADALAIHLNPLQEAVQPEGDVKYRGVVKNIEKLQNELSIPLIIKETGAGLTRDAVQLLKDAGVNIFDISGVGGTSFSAVEVYRAIKSNNKRKEILGKLFWDWGIPTAASLIDLYPLSTEVTIIASGGIRNGLDICKSLALGASLTGMALPFLKAVSRAGVDGGLELVSFIADQLKTCMFLVGAKTIADLKKTNVFIQPPLSEWVLRRFGFENGSSFLEKLANRQFRNE
ncbi:MAG: type 2 isopentenyl-diphosphate Delta-isomerase [Candidatus Asgardarchaeia archaeon]